MFPDDALDLTGSSSWVASGLISRGLYTRDQIKHTRGRPYKSTAADPASCAVTIRNLDGRYAAEPMGPYYGRLGPYTPFRLTLPVDDVALMLPGGVDLVSTPDVAALDVTTGVDVRWEGEVDWNTSGRADAHWQVGHFRKPLVASAA
ncbi:hypothetical protein E4K10_18255 [Streptomyces sp. T1317-0309]|nr:hypothetical protein E4K10_18255 [Streptomyces sp. T1317-0309]